MANILSKIGYALKLPGMGISEPYGTPYNAAQTPGTYSGAIDYRPGTPGSGTTNNFVSTDPNLNTYSNFVKKSTGSVLGANTISGGNNVNNPTQQTTQQNQQTSAPSYADIMTGQINSGYNDYFNSLDQMLNNTLPAQQQAQQNIAQNSYDTSMTDLGLQKTDNQNQLDIQSGKAQTNQVKTLKDISSNIRNLMQGANNYLGALGAGDSSAANQYAYALTKVGSQQSGDVRSQTASTLQDINDKSTQLNNIYMQESNKLKGEYNNQIQEVAKWFADAQGQLIQAKAQGQLSKSQDIQSLTTNLYNQAQQALSSLQTQTAQKQATLETWAANNATNINQLKQNMAQVSQYTAQNPTYSLAGATPTATPQASTGGAYGGYAGGEYDKYLKGLLGK
jgi:hypothetical protein